MFACWNIFRLVDWLKSIDTILLTVNRDSLWSLFILLLMQITFRHTFTVYKIQKGHVMCALWLGIWLWILVQNNANRIAFHAKFSTWNNRFVNIRLCYGYSDGATSRERNREPETPKGAHWAVRWADRDVDRAHWQVESGRVHSWCKLLLNRLTFAALGVLCDVIFGVCL